MCFIGINNHCCGGEFGHSLELEGLRLGLDNLLAKPCDENHHDETAIQKEGGRPLINLD